MSVLDDDVDLPEPTIKACNECPWRRISVSGHLGPMGPEQWAQLAHSDAAVACHKTIQVSGSWEGAKQCFGMGQFRRNIMKDPRNPEVWTAEDRDDVNFFGWHDEFIAHHQKGRRR